MIEFREREPDDHHSKAPPTTILSATSVLPWSIYDDNISLGHITNTSNAMIGAESKIQSEMITKIAELSLYPIIRRTVLMVFALAVFEFFHSLPLFYSGSSLS